MVLQQSWILEVRQINIRVMKNHVSAFAHTLHVQVCIISESMLQSDMYRAATWSEPFDDACAQLQEFYREACDWNEQNGENKASDVEYTIQLQELAK